MPLMRLDVNIHRALSVSVLIAAIVGSMMTQETPAPVIDLTSPPPREQQVRAIPGASIGGIGGQPLPAGYPLPLKIELTSIYPQPVKLGDKFTAEVSLRNTSATPFLLPASRNGTAILQHEGKGRRSFIFSLVFQDTKNGHEITSIAAVAMGAETVKDSLFRIEPGKEVRVLFNGELGPFADWPRHDLGEIQVRAGASETTFEDRRYFVKSESERVVSDRAQTIRLK